MEASRHQGCGAFPGTQRIDETIMKPLLLYDHCGRVKVSGRYAQARQGRE